MLAASLYNISEKFLIHLLFDIGDHFAGTCSEYRGKNNLGKLFDYFCEHRKTKWFRQHRHRFRKILCRIKLVVYL